MTFTVSATRRGALTQLAEQTGATEFMVYQAVLAVMLHKLGGGTDIPVGSPVASRIDSTTHHLIGLFANMVVLRNDLSGDPSLRTVIARSRDAVLDAFAHQELPIERLVEAINPPRSRSRNPLFQNMIHFRGEDWALIPRDLTATENHRRPTSDGLRGLAAGPGHRHDRDAGRRARRTGRSQCRSLRAATPLR